MTIAVLTAAPAPNPDDLARWLLRPQPNELVLNYFTHLGYPVLHSTECSYLNAGILAAHPRLPGVLLPLLFEGERVLRDRGELTMYLCGRCLVRPRSRFV